jgi:hypothetical protein
MQIHSARARKIGTDVWIADCPTCGKVGLGPDIRCAELAMGLAEVHRSIYRPQ